MSLLESVLDKICPADAGVAVDARRKLDSLTKPQGSLGMLEECAVRYVAARGDLDARIENPAILTFAGDHGVAEEGVSAFPQSVTLQMIANFANGGAGINVLARHIGASLVVIDMGVAGDSALPSAPGCTLLCRSIAPGTKNFARGPAMSRQQAVASIEAGIEVAQKAVADGATLLGTGDMGIANTTSSAALYSVFLDILPEAVVGRGTGIDDSSLSRKIEVVKMGLEVNARLLGGDALDKFSAVGGFEIGGICGLVLGAASEGVPVVIDGYISTAAAVVARAILQNCGSSVDLFGDYCFFSHLSAESGHSAVMGELGAKPLLDLGLRLGEGTGAALAFNIIDASLKIMREMATFSSAGVSEKS
ncbi:MAG: nicotinate-nucleotide--dimethylbenzimidazole phosphoribosyltransferase [Victivallales bacterium]|nr:nicotinate-nucleotide--dimethylbenzimidazole phosphoribosyltransferase [Victivallales bacterium]